MNIKELVNQFLFFALVKNKRQSKSVDISDREDFISKALSWASKHSHFAYFNPNSFSYPFLPYQHFIAIGCAEKIIFNGKDDFELLKNKLIYDNDIYVGHFGYNLKDQIEKLESNHKDTIGFDRISFFKPMHIIWLDEDIKIESHDKIDDILNHIKNEKISINNLTIDFSFKPRVVKSEYLKTVNQLKNHIIEGDIYEINYCQEFYAHNIIIDPISTFESLVTKSPTPFSTLYKCNNHYLICASPERYLKKEGDKLISQPIKGTAKRGKSNYEDELIKQELRTNEKELAENMMIVDLVRNDLSKSSKSGTVKVEEMFGIYTFSQLHQMISTVSGQINDNIHAVDAIKNSFPMGSMTGAPKYKVMELIEKYEKSNRGLYSGSIGYFLPSGDFDFNVVIRSLLYNSETKTCSFQVGGAITYDSNPESEYEECLLKAEAITSLFKIDKN